MNALIALCVLCMAASPALAALYGYENAADNLINNWDLEQDLGSNDFVVNRAVGDLITDGCHTGSQCMRFTQRYVPIISFSV